MKISASNTLTMMHGLDQVLSIAVYMFTLDADKRHIRYISRVMCTASLHVAPHHWNGPVSRSLLAFNSMVVEVSNNMRNLVEMVVLAMLIHGDADRLAFSPVDYTTIGLRYGFGV